MRNTQAAKRPNCSPSGSTPCFATRHLTVMDARVGDGRSQEAQPHGAARIGGRTVDPRVAAATVRREPQLRADRTGLAVVAHEYCLDLVPVRARRPRIGVPGEFADGSDHVQDVVARPVGPPEVGQAPCAGDIRRRQFGSRPRRRPGSARYPDRADGTRPTRNPLLSVKRTRSLFDEVSPERERRSATAFTCHTRKPVSSAICPRNAAAASRCERLRLDAARSAVLYLSLQNAATSIVTWIEPGVRREPD